MNCRPLLLLGFFLAELVRGAALPAITAAPGGRGFRTAADRPFVPFGVTYYRPGTGWAPQVWKQFDADATRRDFIRMRQLGVNCVRVFLSFGSFLPEPGAISPDGLRKFDQFLAIAEETGIYVHPTGPDHWEGLPEWAAVDRYSDPRVLEALEGFWREFAQRYRGRTVIFAIDLLNEPAIPWESLIMNGLWVKWVHARYHDQADLARAWGAEAVPDSFDHPTPPPAKNDPGSRRLLDYQKFREDRADIWIRRQVDAIRAVDPHRLITAGLVQWSVPSLLPMLQHYAAFRPSRLAPMLDFMEIHFYPFDHGFYEYESPESRERNLSYLEGVVREVSGFGKPAMVAEFGWYGGGQLTSDEKRHPAASEEEQADWDRGVIETSRGLATGWLNWGFYDQPEATDCSQLSGLLTAEGKVKAWGRVFQQLADRDREAIFRAKEIERPALDWDACLTDTAAGNRFRESYWRAYSADPSRKSSAK